MFFQKKHLILIDAERKKWVSKDLKNVDKIEYTFLDKEGNLMASWEDAPGTYVKDVQNVDAWDEAFAKDYVFIVKLFKGSKTYKLQPKGAKLGV
jgi:hypothetical protein